MLDNSLLKAIHMNLYAMTSLITSIKQILQSLWMRLPADTRRTVKGILLFDYLYTVPRYTRTIVNREIPFTPPCAKPIQPPQHANYHEIQAFPFPQRGSDERQLFLFYDIFARDKQLFITFVKKDHEALGISTEDIHITVNQQALTLKETIVGQNKAGTSVYAFDYPFTEHQVCISCKGINKDFTISHICPKQISLLLHSTMFQDDHFLLPMFYDYYTKQGVDSFVWYYNGVFDQALRHQYAFGDNVIILDWPYPYFIQDQANPCGQSAQIMHALYKYGKSSYEYIGFLDLDEYVKTECANLRSYILQNPGYLCYAFLNCWAWVLRLRTTSSKRWQHLPRVLLRAKIPTRKTSPFIVKNADSSTEKYYCLWRSKFIYQTTRIKKIYFHSYPASCSDDTAQERIPLIKLSSVFLHVTNLRKGHSQEKRYHTFSDYFRRGWD